MAKKCGKTPNQVLVRYALQKGWIPLPKSENPERIKANADVYDFEIPKAEMERLDSLDQGRRGRLTCLGRETTCWLTFIRIGYLDPSVWALSAIMVVGTKAVELETLYMPKMRSAGVWSKYHSFRDPLATLRRTSVY